MSTTFYGKELPNGLYVCGDHMATATLNGAVESGVSAGTDVADAIMGSSLTTATNTEEIGSKSKVEQVV